MHLYSSSYNYKAYIPIHIKRCDTFLKRLKGLMFQREPIKDEGILIVPCNSIHMFFMSFPIDVVFIDHTNCIVKFKKYIKPWTMIFPIPNAYAAFELPAGTIEKYNLNIGDYIK